MKEETAAQEQEETYDKWRAESDLRTLTEAKKIQKNTARMKNVRRAAKEKLAEIESYKQYAAGKA